MKKPMSAFILIAVLWLSAPVCAEIYKYTDENGQKRWTDDLSQVPKQQRAAAQRIETETKKPVDAIPEKSEKAQPETTLETNAALPETGTADETAEFSRAALEEEKAELDRLYQQLLEERKQIEKLTPQALDTNARAELNARITAFNQKTKRYEAQSNAFKEKIDAYNEWIMSKRPTQTE
jgi:hypothetical protein